MICKRNSQVNRDEYHVLFQKLDTDNNGTLVDLCSLLHSYHLCTVKILEYAMSYLYLPLIAILYSPFLTFFLLCLVF